MTEDNHNVMFVRRSLFYIVPPSLGCCPIHVFSCQNITCYLTSEIFHSPPWLDGESLNLSCSNGVIEWSMSHEVWSEDWPLMQLKDTTYHFRLANLCTVYVIEVVFSLMKSSQCSLYSSVDWWPRNLTMPLYCTIQHNIRMKADAVSCVVCHQFAFFDHYLSLVAWSRAVTTSIICTRN